jgi:valyl-tRNA synthetase
VVLARLAETIASVTQKIETYQLSSAGEELRDFTWNDLADWYLEIAKVEKGKSAVLRELLQAVLKLWHPFMPFVTEYVWGMAGFGGQLIVAAWPKTASAEAVPGFEALRQLVTDLRRLRSEQGVEPAKQVSFAVSADAKMQALVQENLAWIKRLTNAADLMLAEKIAEGWPVITTGLVTVGLDRAGAVDLEKERGKIDKELATLEPYITSTKAKLEDADFTGKAPQKVVDGMREKLDQAKKKRALLLEQRQALR